MIGQTLAAKGKPYRYYRCRHVYDKNTGRSCSARYIRCERLEDTVWSEVVRVLANPEVVLRERQRPAKEKVDEAEASRLEAALADLREREKRLVRLYTLGEFREGMLRTERANISSQRQVFKEQLWSLKSQVPLFVQDMDQEQLKYICTAVADWLDRADEPGKALALEALQITVLATVDEARISGVLPIQVPDAIRDEPASDCLDFLEQPGLPFDRAIRLST